MLKKTGIVVAFLLALAITAPVLAVVAYTAIISVTTNTSYTQAPVIVSNNNTFLAANGYIASNGLDVQIQTGGTSIPAMIADNKTLFVANLLLGTNSFNYVTGNSPNTSMPIITGNGNVTTNYSASLNLGGNFSVNVPCELINTTNQTVFQQLNAFTLASTSNGTGANLTAAINSTVVHSVNLTPAGAGTYTSIVSFNGAATHWQSQLTNDGNFSIVYQTSTGILEIDTYAMQQASRPIGFIQAVAVFNVIAGNANGGTAQQTELLTHGVVYNGTSNPNPPSNVFTTYSDNYTTNPFTGLAWTWQEVNSLEAGVGLTDFGVPEIRSTQVYVTVYYSPVVMAQNISTNLTTVNVTADSNNLSIYINNVLQDTTALNGAVANSTGSFLMLQNVPYANNISLSTNGSQRFLYSPNTIIIGSNLPDRVGTYNGTINFGSNLAGVTVSSLGTLTPASSITGLPSLEGGNTPDVLPNTVNIDPTMTSTPSNPLSPFVSALATLYDFTALSMWFWVGLIVTLAVFIGMAKLSDHLGWTLIVTSVVMGAFSVIHVFPIGMLYIAILILITGVVVENRA